MRFPFLSFLTKKPAHRPPVGEVHVYYDPASKSMRRIDSDGNDYPVFPPIKTGSDAPDSLGVSADFPGQIYVNEYDNVAYVATKVGTDYWYQISAN